MPTIGIGAGPDTTGQVLVTNDVIGFTSGYMPKFVRQMTDVKSAIADAATTYKAAVADGTFPGKDESFK